MGYRTYDQDDGDDDPIVEMLEAESSVEDAAPSAPSIAPQPSAPAPLNYSAMSTSGRQVPIAPPPLTAPSIAPPPPPAPLNYSAMSTSGRQIPIAPPPLAAPSIAPPPPPPPAATLQAVPKQPFAGSPLLNPLIHTLGGSAVPLKSLDGTEHAGENTRAQNPVKYVSDRRAKYEVTIDGKMMRNSVVFDTARIKALYFRKINPTSKIGAELLTEEEKDRIARKPPKTRPNVGSFTFGSTNEEAARLKPLWREWARTSLLWVCGFDDGSSVPAFYSHVGKINKFHHSSFLAGEAVVGAGEWIVREGKLLQISANSGHYRPSMDHFHRSVLHLSRAFHKETCVLLWNTRTKDYELVPVVDFIHNPSGHGVYKVHPSA